MKLKTLFEGPPPYEVEENLPNLTAGTSVSTDTLYRDFNRIAMLSDFESEADTDLDIYLAKDKSGCLATVPPDASLKDGRNLVIVRLMFKPADGLKIPKDINRSKVLQVSLVSIPKAFAGGGIVSSIYKLLALKYEVIVFSDDVQYRGGKMLWKKIARDSMVDGLTVRIINTVTGEYISDSKNAPVVYDGKNLQDWDVWCSKNDFHNQPLLLVLSK